MGAIDADDLAFLDGYLFRVMVELLQSKTADESGLYDYYQVRIERDGNALSNYDKLLFAYVLEHFDRESRQILHAGIGIGTLASALAVAGYSVGGIERDSGRFCAASHIRSALAEIWPEAAERYTLIDSEFPACIVETSWSASNTVLIFTNCGAGWSEALTAQAIAAFPSQGDVILDTRLFGNIRDLPAERQTLVKQIEALGLVGQPIADMPGGTHFYHFRRCSRSL